MFLSVLAIAMILHPPATLPRTLRSLGKLGKRQSPSLIRKEMINQGQTEREHVQHMSWGQKTNKHETHKHFSDGPLRDNCPRDKPGPVPGADGTKWRFSVDENGRFVPWTGPGFSQERVPLVPGKVPALSQTPSRQKCLR